MCPEQGRLLLKVIAEVLVVIYCLLESRALIHTLFFSSSFLFINECPSVYYIGNETALYFMQLF
jgi:hypothetical protein